MFRLIREVRPDYVVGENVPGLLSIENGMVFEQVCIDMESEGYEVQTFVLPACAVGAPHRRDRIWIVANSTNNGHSRGYSKPRGEERESESGWMLKSTGKDSGTTPDTQSMGWERRGSETHSEQQDNLQTSISGIPKGYCKSRVTANSEKTECKFSGESRTGREGFADSITSNTTSAGSERNGRDRQQKSRIQSGQEISGCNNARNYWHDWPTISPFHIGHDGLSSGLVQHIRTSLTEAGETPERIEAYIRKEANWIRKQGIMGAGNAVVPQVVLQIFKAIEFHYNNLTHAQS